MILTLITLACSGPPGEAAAPPTQAQSAPLAPSAPSVITLGETVTLMSEGGLSVERQRWLWAPDDGQPPINMVTYRARAPLNARLSVRPSEGVAPFEALLPQEELAPWVAINGGFYEEGAMGLVVSGGKEHTPLSPRGGSGVLFWSPAGAQIVHRDDWRAGPPEALQSIDRLVNAGASVVKTVGGAQTARSAVVVGKEQVWLVISAAEATVTTTGVGALQLGAAEHAGPTLGVFADYLLHSTDAVTALNLDGGISTQLAAVIDGQRLVVTGQAGTINAVVMRPPAGP